MNLSNNNNVFNIVLAIALCATLIACDEQTNTPSQAQANSAASIPTRNINTPGSVIATPLNQITTSNDKLFSLQSPDKTGINFVSTIDTKHPDKRLYTSGFASGGIAIGDIDNDGKPDIYITSGPKKNKLYKQTKNFKFIDITKSAGVDGGEGWSAGTTLVDIDNDNDLDIYLCIYDKPNKLYINQGNGKFIEKAKQYKLDIVDASLMPTFCDYDNDGDLDVYIVTNRYYREQGRPHKPPFKMINGKPVVLPEFEKYYGLVKMGPKKFNMDTYGRADYLMQNNGDGTFSNVNEKAGISGGKGHGLSATWWDYNNDGFPDLYIANDFQDPDHFYKNNGDGTFTNIVKTAVPNTAWFSMGADFGDINNDGLFDFIVGDMNPTSHFMQKTTMGAMGKFKWFLSNAMPRQYMRNMLYLNAGNESFMEAGQMTHLAKSDWTWAVKIADWDNDGWNDVFFANGMIRNINDSDSGLDTNDFAGKTEWDLHESTPPRPEKNKVLRNKGNLAFQDVSNDWGLDHIGMSYAAAYSDLDRDGDLDLVVINLDQPVNIYKNQSPTGNRLLVKLQGTKSNSLGYGARVTITSDQGKQTRQLLPASGFNSSNEPILHFGLGSQNIISKMTIDWPSGQTQTIENIKKNRLLTITEPNTKSTIAKTTKKQKTIYKQTQTLTNISQIEKDYDDFAVQPLLPNKMSQLGASMAWGDANGDGQDDLYITGAAGQVGKLYLKQADGKFKKAKVPAFATSFIYEDMAPLWIDFDADGDLDLYVVSGGVESKPNSSTYKDRLYINDGKANFKIADNAILPNNADSGSIVTAADYDRDGDLDLFIGSRVIPGQYPLTPKSRLLQNNNGKYTEVTDKVAPGLKNSGLVTSAVWSDANNDGWIDLLVTNEWGPVKYFQNQNGKLVDQTKQANLDKRLGWWNSIAARDLDNDGDIDYVVTNFGLNTKYHASVEKPTLIYAADFDNTGRIKIVEAEYEGNKLFPIRGKSCSTGSMPFVSKKFKTYKNFALATVTDIYTPKCIDNAQKFQANQLLSGVLINDGTANFTFKPLPQLAQISPGFGIVTTEVNGDGIPDLYIVQNFFSPQPETGRMNGGLSILLTGKGDGTFNEVWPNVSGLSINGDAKGLTVTDLNQDGLPDFVISINNGDLQTYQHQGLTSGATFTLKLIGKKGNIHATGARVTITLSDDSTQTAEIHTGGGYLSQSSSTLTFGKPAQSMKIKEINIRWPNAQQSTITEIKNQKTMTIKQP